MSGTSAALALSQSHEATNNVAYRARLQTIDLLRGLVIILMALDHVRDFFGTTNFNPVDLTQTSATLFMTRWITNLCAPTFFFLAGVSAFLYEKNYGKNNLSKFLFKRGIWLIFLEVTVITFGWNLVVGTFSILQVMWALGLSMVILSGLVFLPKQLLWLITISAIAFHNLFDNFAPDTLLLKNIWYFVHAQGLMTIGDWRIAVLYPIVPWFAVMGLGFLLGSWFQKPVEIRSIYFSRLGSLFLISFIILRSINQYGNPATWKMNLHSLLFNFLDFINVAKYPPSLDYLLLTLGIVFSLLPYLERWNRFGNRFVLCFGKVSLFFYILHIYLISTAAELYSRFVYGLSGGWWWRNPVWRTDALPIPSDYHFQLMRVYLVWILLILVAYPICARYQQFKSKHRYAWLSYL